MAQIGRGISLVGDFAARLRELVRNIPVDGVIARYRYRSRALTAHPLRSELLSTSPSGNGLKAETS